MKRLNALVICLVLGLGLLSGAFAAQRVVLCEMLYGEG